jgi:Heparinase II/III-like protein
MSRSAVSLLLLAPVLLSFQTEVTAMTCTEPELLDFLTRDPDSPLLPELVDADPAALLSTERGKAILEWANGATGEPIPTTSYTLYRRFRAAGERPPYEKPYFVKRRLLSQHAVGAWLTRDKVHLDRVNDLLWSICEETTWVLPAHEKSDPWNIDLFAAETGVELAHVLLVLGDTIPEEVRMRVHAEVKRRILDPYLEHAGDYWWDNGSNNWTGVCAGSVGQTFLLMDPDAERKAKALALVLGQFERFINVAFEPDGASLEGIGYWNYGLLHYVGLAEMLRARTGGAVDLLAQEKLTRIAHYPAAVALDKHAFASFADSHEHSDVRPFLGARLAERTGVVALQSQIGDWEDWRFSSVLRNVLWWDDEKTAPPLIENALLEASGIAKRVGTAAGLRVVLCAKAGHNAEPHNNNDVGSFALRIGGVTYLCDPGGGLYNKDYFGSKRYENVFANSYGHSVPRIGGALQPAGTARRGVMTVAEDGTMCIAFKDAYDIPQLTALERFLRIQDNGTVLMEDRFAFDGAGLEIEEALITWLDVEVDGDTARVISDEGILEIQAEGVEFVAERLEKACEENHKKEVLTRITVTCPAAAEVRAVFVMRFIPEGSKK